MPVPATPVGDRSQRSGIATFGRDLLHHVGASPRLAPHMGEAEEVKRGAARCRMAFAVRPFAAKVDEPRLVGMEGESIPGKALAEDRLDPLGIGGCSMGMMDFTDFWKLRVYARLSCNETTDLPSFITLIR
jgi:hypothetical protein